MILAKKLKFLSSLLCFEKGRELYFYDVVYRKRRVFRLPNIIFTSSKNLHSSKIDIDKIVIDFYRKIIDINRSHNFFSLLISID